jgi:hypothetical protein
MGTCGITKILSEGVFHGRKLYEHRSECWTLTKDKQIKQSAKICFLSTVVGYKLYVSKHSADIKN